MTPTTLHSIGEKDNVTFALGTLADNGNSLSNTDLNSFQSELITDWQGTGCQLEIGFPASLAARGNQVK